MQILSVDTMSGRTIKFDKVSIKGTKSYVCEDCGKRRRETQEFYQTMSPFNLDADGQPKTRKQIADEVRAERDAWRPGPKCGCVELAKTDHRPDRREPEAPFEGYPQDLVDRIDAANKEIKAIQQELKRRLVGLKFEEDGRECYVTGVYIDRTRVRIEAYRSHKGKPNIEFDTAYMGLSDLMKRIEKSQ